MIFVTVGTQFPFDRLIKAIDVSLGEGLIDEKVIAQVGDSKYTASNIETFDYLDKDAFDDLIKQSCAIISHAGMGTITMAMEYDKPLLVMPRLSKYGEVVNDHQLDITEKFEKLGHLLVAYNEDQLAEKIKQLKTFVPVKRNGQPDRVAARITEFLKTMG